MQCFLSRSLSNQNEAGYCLSVPERTVSEVWKYDMVKETYSILYLVMVVKTDKNFDVKACGTIKSSRVFELVVLANSLYSGRFSAYI